MLNTMIFVVVVIVVLLVLVLMKVVQKLTLGVNKSKMCLVGKTAIITGGNMGIGYHTTLNLASRGCKIIIACRSNAEKVKEGIIKRTGNVNIFVKHLDLCSFASVRKFAEEINGCEERLDILINNAGVAGLENVTEDGLDATLQTNHYGAFLLTHLLIDLLKRSAPSRIVFVSSIFAFFHRPSVDHINDQKTPLFKYSDTKLLQIATARILEKKLKSDGVTANALHPGIVKTEVFDKVKTDWLNKLLMNLYYYVTLWFMKTPEEGAQTSIHVAISEKLENVSGKFFMDCRSFPLPRLACNEEFCRNVWKLSEGCVGLKKDEML